MNQVIKTATGYQIIFGFDPAILAAVKRIPGRRYTPSGGWSVPFSSREAVERLALRYNLYMDGLDTWEKEEFDYTVKPLRPLQTQITLKKPLYSFQAEGVQYILDHNKVIVGDKPGLGKTAQAIAAVVAKKAFPCLIVCPSTLKYNWKSEIEEKWTACKAEILDNSIGRTWQFLYQCGMAQFFIVNYESLKKFFVQRINTPAKPEGETPKRKTAFMLKDVVFKQEASLFASLIVDEAHRCKEITTQQTKLVKGLSIGRKMCLLLTGTPVVNTPEDLISLLGILDHFGNRSPFGTYKQFKNRFCSTDRNWDKLQVLLRNNCYYSREKKDVLKDLPEKTRTVVKCDITTRREYEDALTDLSDYLVRYQDADDEKVQRAMRGEVMVRIGILKNISARGKLNSVAEYVGDLLASGEKMILFVHLKDVAKMLKGFFPSAVTILGEDGMEEREAAVQKFQNDPKTQLIICSIKAAGVGLTLTAAHTVGFVELPWHGADCEQCEDRAHRIGQKDSVDCLYFLGKDTIDEHIYQIIQKKIGMARAITGERNETREEVLDSLIELLSKNKKERSNK